MYNLFMMSNYRTVFIWLVFCLFSVSFSHADPFPYEVQRGERPPIRYEEIEPDAFESGVLLLKFTPEMTRHLDRNPVSVDKDGIVSFRLDDVDRLNARYGVKGAVQHFISPALKNSFSERHKAWGFHLWYRLEMDDRTDIIEMMESYKNLHEVEVAEPSFRKKLIGSEEPDAYLSLDTGHSGMTAKRSDGWIPDDPQFDAQWHYLNTGQHGGTPGADISLPQAWEIEKGNTDVIVAIVDGGIDHNHQDLAGNMWEEIGYNFVYDSPVIEPHNHGTHVAGTVAAVNNNNIGVSGVAGGSGANDGVRLMSAQVFASASNGGFHIAPVYAADNGAAISQNSWGYTFAGYYEQSVLDAIDYFNTHGGGDAMEGGITIFAAGNSDSSADYYPGYYSGCFAVAGTNNEDAKAWYSNFGDYIDVSAPGGETGSVVQRGVLSALNNDQYGFYQGTSMACPHVSGVAALILSLVYGELSAGDVAEILTMTTDNHYAANPGYPGLLGSGRLNAYEALQLAELFLILPANPSNFTAAGVSDSEISLSWEKNNEGHDVMLAWSHDGTFGAPEEGTVYEAGEDIPGGGQVLYLGDGTTFSHLGLDASTQYHYRIWSADDQYLYSYGRNTEGRTLCGVEPLPVNEGFDGGDVPYCWEFDPHQGNWQLSTSQGNPAPAMQFNWSPSLTNYSFSLISPPYDGDIPGSAIALEFDIMLDNYSTNTVEEMSVEVFDGEGWNQVLAFDNTGGDIAWDSHLVDITPYAIDNVFMVRFRAHGANSFNLNYWVIDNFKLYSYSCPPPYELAAENITYEGAEISWTAVGDESSWDIIWDEQGFNPEHEGNHVEGLGETFFLLSGLEVMTYYDVYARADCGDDDISAWAGPLGFQTLATCPAPGDIFVEHINALSAEISWIPEGEEELWDILWDESGFNPDTEGNLIEGVTENPYLLEGLSIVTEYDVYVRAFCSEDDESIWTGPATFTTPCDVFQLPFAEDFDGPSVDCWEFPEGQGNWRFGTSYAPPSSESGPPHAYFSWTPSLTNYSHSLASPVIDQGSTSSPVMIDFIAFLNNFDNNNLEQLSVEYKTVPETEWTLIETFSNQGVGSGSQEFIRTEQVLHGVAGQHFQVRFRAHGQNSFSINAWSVDDVLIYVDEDFEDQYYTVTFDVRDTDGNPINDATIIMEDAENDPGNYVFEEIPPGTHNFTVLKDCHPVVEDSLTVTDNDKVVEVTLTNLPGDANGDGIVDVLDVIAISNYHTGLHNGFFCFENADVNQDGVIDVLDVIATINLTL